MDVLPTGTAVAALGGLALGVANRIWPPRVEPAQPWVVAKGTGDAFVMTNLTGARATGFRVECSLDFNWTSAETDVVDAGASVSLLIEDSIVTGAAIVTVHWRDARSRAHTWATTLP
jgi:hypothetical protein